VKHDGNLVVIINVIVLPFTNTVLSSVPVLVLVWVLVLILELVLVLLTSTSTSTKSGSTSTRSSISASASTCKNMAHYMGISMSTNASCKTSINTCLEPNWAK
jgi:hypothetical protein